MYSPCFECLNRYGKQYSEDCNDICEYAHAVKSRDADLEELKSRIAAVEDKLDEHAIRH